MINIPAQRRVFVPIFNIFVSSKLRTDHKKKEENRREYIVKETVKNLRPCLVLVIDRNGEQRQKETFERRHKEKKRLYLFFLFSHHKAIFLLFLQALFFLLILSFSYFIYIPHFLFFSFHILYLAFVVFFIFLIAHIFLIFLFSSLFFHVFSSAVFPINLFPLISHYFFYFIF